MLAGWHYLPSNVDDGTPLGASTYLDLDPGVGQRSAEQLVRLYFKGRPDPKEIAQKAKGWPCRVQIGNEPNHPIEQFGGGPAEYAAWFLDVLNNAPASRLYFAGMSPGFPDWRDWHTHPLARAAIARSSGIAAHAYGNLGQMREVVEFLIPFGKPLWLAEVNFGAGQQVDRDVWARDHFRPFLDYCATVPLVEAVTYFAYRWQTPDMALPTPVDGAGTAIEGVLREWTDRVGADSDTSAPEVGPSGTPTETSRPAPAAPPKKEPPMRDMRGKLPTLQGNWTQLAYHSRPVSGIVGATLHYTAGPAGQTAEQIAAYQTSPAAAQQTGADQPFPGIAYTVTVIEDGTAVICHALGVRTWHSAAVVDGVKWNAARMGIVYTGKGRPNAAQVRGIATAIRWGELGQSLGREWSIDGHKDQMATSCPPEWPAWRGEVERELTKLRGGTMPDPIEPQLEANVLGPIFKAQAWLLANAKTDRQRRWQAVLDFAFRDLKGEVA